LVYSIREDPTAGGGVDEQEERVKKAAVSRAGVVRLVFMVWWLVSGLVSVILKRQPD
jgi:hypothetical protein